MAKPLVFISYIKEEKEIALALKKLIDDAWNDMIDVFVASDPESIKLGRKWLNEITDALKTCEIEIILASPESVTRPWINFEAGAAFIRDKPVIPLCHSGMTTSELPDPLAALQSVAEVNAASLKTLFRTLAEVAESAEPQVDFSKFISVVKDFEATSRQIKTIKAASPVAPTGGLSPIELTTLVEIGDYVGEPDAKAPIYKVRELIEKAGLTGIAVTLAVKMLGRKELVETSVAYDERHEFSAIRVTDKGWEWLEANQDKLKLTSVTQPPTAKASPPAQKADDIPF